MQKNTNRVVIRNILTEVRITDVVIGLGLIAVDSKKRIPVFIECTNETGMMYVLKCRHSTNA